MPVAVLRELAVGGGGKEVMRLLADAQRSKNLLLLRMVVTLAWRGGHTQARNLTDAYDRLADAQNNQPMEIEPLLRYPTVGAWALSAVRDLHREAVVDHDYLTALSATAAVLARSDCAVKVPISDGHVFLPFLGRADLGVTDGSKTATLQPSQVSCTISAGGVQVSPSRNFRLDRDRWHGIRQLTTRGHAGIVTTFLIDDLDPYQPAVGVRSHRLDATDLEQWQLSLDDAWTLLTAHHPLIAEEVAAGVTTFVPLRSKSGQRMSATGRNTFGAIALSKPLDGRVLASDLAHECQHAKLGALLDLVSLFNDSHEKRWYVPWRDDPRPLCAVLQGAYAYLGVAGFWRKQRDVDDGRLATQAHAEFLRCRENVSVVLAMIYSSGGLTPLGIHFVNGMAATLDEWRENQHQRLRSRSFARTVERQERDDSVGQEPRGGCE